MEAVHSSETVTPTKLHSVTTQKIIQISYFCNAGKALKWYKWNSLILIQNGAYETLTLFGGTSVHRTEAKEQGLWGRDISVGIPWNMSLLDKQLSYKLMHYGLAYATGGMLNS
jgi:hypothetical protein